MYNTYLAIGSIVMLKGEGKKIMVIGYCGLDGNGKASDYMGVTYPEGYMNADSIIGFNEIEVLQVLHEGYKDVEQDRYFNELSAFLKGINTQKKPTVPFVNTPTQPVQSVQQTVPNDNEDIDTI